MKLSYFTLLLSVSLLSACASDKAVRPISYQCSDGQIYSITAYQNELQENFVTLKLPNEQKITLINVVAASGSKYVGSTYEWWSKGNTAFFSDGNNAMLECSVIEAK